MIHSYRMKKFLQSRVGIYVKSYEFLSFAKDMSKNVNSKYKQRFLDTTNNLAKDALNISSQRALQNATTAAGDVVGNKIEEKLVSAAS